MSQTQNLPASDDGLARAVAAFVNSGEWRSVRCYNEFSIFKNGRNTLTH